MNAAHWTLERDAGDIAWLTLDRRESSANVLSRDVLLDLDGLLSGLAAAPPRGLVLRSGKTSGFVAGADIREFTALDRTEQAFDLVRSARPGEGDPAMTRGIAWGPGPRAAQALMLASRARALVDGRLSPSLDDIVALAAPVLKHRMALTFAARAEGETIGGVIQRLVEKVV